MGNDGGELDRFKSGINLSEYAAGFGFVVDREKSTKSSVQMRHADGDKIVITRQTNGHYTYFARANDQDRGTVIDFHRQRTGESLGETRKSLRRWLGEPSKRPAVADYVHDIGTVEYDFDAVRAAFARTKTVSSHPYLEQRGLDASVVGDERFAGRVREDGRGNVIFPHYGRDGVTGYEIRNQDVKSFSKGGQKAVWTSNWKETDTRLVITESPIDAMSHYALHRDANTAYLATGGAWGPSTEARLKDAIMAFKGSEVVLAFDNDKQGAKYAQDATRVVKDVDQQAQKQAMPRGWLKKSATVILPGAGIDWNDELKKMREQDLGLDIFQ